MYNFKICGITNNEIAQLLDNLKCDMIGFCCVETSPRYINAKQAHDIAKNLKFSKSVILYQNEKIEKVISDLKNYKFDYVQFHGDECENYIQKVKQNIDIGVIKSISVSTKNCLNKIKIYDGIVDILLFDTKLTGNLNNGGHGVNFDWSLVYNVNTKSAKMIAGGLNIFNIENCKDKSNINFFDLSSGVEKTKGIKDKSLIEELFYKYKV